MKPTCILCAAFLILSCIGSLFAEKPVDTKPTKKPASAKSAPAKHKAGEERTFDGIKFVWIPAGEFQMGSSEAGRYRLLAAPWSNKWKWTGDEGPVRRVKITEDFWMGKYEVTNGEYRRFNPNHDIGEFEGHSLNGDKQPVVQVSWDDAVAFCAKLSEKSSSGSKYRLPTEAEWEYACRAGTTTRFYWGDSLYKGRGWINGVDKSFEKAFPEIAKADTHKHYLMFGFYDGYAVSAPVGSFRSNGWGLYDMHGNVCEWCSDWYDKDYYGTRPDPDRDPTGPSRSSLPMLDTPLRVSRGGRWYDYALDCRSDCRSGSIPRYRNFITGFRLCRSSD